MYNADATWCTNESCSCKTKCWRWIGFYEGDILEPEMVRHYDGGEECSMLVRRIDGKDRYEKEESSGDAVIGNA